MRIALVGTDTAVGKTHVCLGLARGLRALGRRVWLHKPVACGGWDGASSEDGRRLRAACADGQDPATVCPREFPAECSPHLAAADAGAVLALADLAAAARAVAVAAPGDLLLETAGGLLAPIDAGRRSNADLLSLLGWPVLLVTRPHLGTLNHTALTVEALRHRGLRPLGLVLNRHADLPDGIAVRSAPGELAALTGLPVLAEVHHGASGGPALAEAVLAAHAAGDAP